MHVVVDRGRRNAFFSTFTQMRGGGGGGGRF